MRTPLPSASTPRAPRPDASRSRAFARLTGATSGARVGTAATTARTSRRAWGAAIALSVAAALPLAQAGCVGTLGDASESGCETCGPGTQQIDPVATLRFPRLTHQQWENTIVDLFHLPAPLGLSAAFTGDPLGGYFDNAESSLQVSPPHWADYQLAAEEVAELVTDDPALLSQIVPASLPADPALAARAFVEAFGRRAYRRPLTTAEVDAYAALFATGDATVDGPDAFTRGVRITLMAFLQSPHFLYRPQLGAVVEGDRVRLSSHELATRLSYALWNTMPDAALDALADAGELDDPATLEAEARRMLADPRARAMVSHFHELLLRYEAFENLNKDEVLFPDWTPDVGLDMQEEERRFVEHVVFEEGGGLRELLTSSTTFVNDRLAALYGLSGSFGPEFVEVELDPSERSGLLTHLGFLASNATKREQHTIYRGVYVNHRILCAPLPDPPNNVPPLPSAGDYDTNRERVEAHTGPGTCGASCHGVWINPAGYPFEHYDALGRYRELENGHEIDASGDYELDGAMAHFDDALEWTSLMAESDMAHACYAKHWLEYLYGRRAEAADDLVLPELTGVSRESALELVVALVTAEDFRMRNVDEEVSQ